MQHFFTLALLCFTLLLSAHTASSETLEDDELCAHKIKGVSPLHSYEEAKRIFLEQGLYILTEDTRSFSRYGEKFNLRKMRVANFKGTNSQEPGDFQINWIEDLSTSRTMRNGTEPVYGVSVMISYMQTNAHPKNSKEGWVTASFAPYLNSWIEKWCEEGNPSRRCNVSPRQVRAHLMDIPKTQVSFIPHCGLQMTTRHNLSETITTYPVGAPKQY